MRVFGIDCGTEFTGYGVVEMDHLARNPRLLHLAAGAIKPRSGYSYAFRNGADFICNGMFDYQVEDNVALIKELLPKVQRRKRAWMA